MSEGVREEYKVLGRVLGTVSGWDGYDHLAIVLYDFIPMRGVALPPASSLHIDFVKGLFRIYDDEGMVTNQIDIISALAA